MSLQRIILFSIGVAFVSNAWAQFDSKTEDRKSEKIYDRIEKVEATKAEKRRKKTKKKLKKKFTTLSDLGDLAPFDDVAVIQRRYLPKTQRFELSALGGISTNNQFFNNLGVGFKGAYYFSDKYGIEATYLYLSSSERPVTEGLKDKQNIRTTSIVEPESYMGAAFKWVPFYGKIAWFQEKIIPFDLYIAPGFGITSTAIGEDESTFSISAGQSFALTQSSAIRWDLTWNFYKATVQQESAGTTTQNQNDLYMMIGYSFYFPEATYR